MTSGYDGVDRRREHQEFLCGIKTNIDVLQRSVDNMSNVLVENGKKLSYINGDVKRSKEDIISIKKRITYIERIDAVQDGVRKGMSLLSASARYTIIVIVAIIGCYFAGVNAFTKKQNKLEKTLELIINKYNHNIADPTNKTPITRSEIFLLDD